MRRRMWLVCAAVLTASVPLAAQPDTARRGAHLAPCADSTHVRYRERMLVDLVYEGANRSEMWMAIDLAAKARCIVSRNARVLPDTTVYGRLIINALDDGGYEIATALGGVASQRPECRSKRAAIVSGDRPILWGVLLAHVVENFVECAFAVRASRSP